MRHLDLFSGIGGFALACRMVGGIETVGFVEREPFCQSVLRKNFGAGPAIYEDIKTFRGDECGAVDLITGGFPCQPYSVAGKRRGSADDRALWPEMLRVIKASRPTWIVGENVAGIIKLELDRIISDLEDDGYTVRTFAIPALAVDAKHRRNRVWIVAHAKAQYRPEQVQKTHESGRGSQTLAHADRGRCKKLHTAASTGRQEQRSRGTDDAWHEWTSEPELGRVAHGIPNRVDRIRSLGNAIVPKVAAQIIKAIKGVSNEI